MAPWNRWHAASVALTVATPVTPFRVYDAPRAADAIQLAIGGTEIDAQQVFAGLQARHAGRAADGGRRGAVERQQVLN